MSEQMVSSTSLGYAQAVVPKTKASQLKLQMLSAHELCGDLADRWESLRGRDAYFESPYFDINFVKAVAKVRDDVKIAMFLEDEEIVGFLPYQLNSAGRAVPAGGRLNDYHGVIGSTNNLEKHFRATLRENNLKSYAFHALAPPSEQYAAFQFRELQTHHLDLSMGWESYRQWVRKHSSTVKRQGQKTRNLEKEVGPVRFEFDCQSGDVLERLIELKRAKYNRSKTFDILSVQWAADLLRELQTVNQPNFQGILQAMWAGDELVCVHFGLLTDKVLHYWFPIFDYHYSRYSPGTEMMMRVAEESCNRGLTKLDLGYGDDAYKFKFCNGNTRVLNGQVNFNPMDLGVARARYRVRTKLKQMPMKPLAKSILRRVFPSFGQWNFK